VDGWSNDNEPEQILVGDRTMRVRRRVRRRGRLGLVLAVVAVLVLGGVGLGFYLLADRPTGLAALPNPAVIAPGAFRASVGTDSTITVGLEIRNTTDVSVDVISARIVTPSGLTRLEVALIPPGEGNQGFALDGPLPASHTVTLGTEATKRNGILAARFKVDCATLPRAGGPTGEQLFVTVKVGEEQREEELTSPVVNGTPWLTATARRVCAPPSSPGPAPSPLEPLPGSTPSA
jgi:hypothetical protein